MTDGLDHPFDLMFPSLMNGDFEPRITLRFADFHHFCRRGESILEFDAAFEGFDFVIIKNALDFDQICFRNMVAGVQERLCQLSMVCEQHETFTVEIQPSDRKHPHGHSMQKILHRRTTFGIVQSGHHVFRLVEDKVYIGLRSTQMFAVHLDMILIRINLGAEFLHDMAVDRHAPGRNELLGLAPRRQPGTGDKFL
jgi:hypothetical protein